MALVQTNPALQELTRLVAWKCAQKNNKSTTSSTKTLASCDSAMLRTASVVLLERSFGSRPRLALACVDT